MILYCSTGLSKVGVATLLGSRNQLQGLQRILPITYMYLALSIIFIVNGRGKFEEVEKGRDQKSLDILAEAYVFSVDVVLNVVNLFS